jgi:hypothetical protein
MRIDSKITPFFGSKFFFIEINGVEIERGITVMVENVTVFRADR